MKYTLTTSISLVLLSILTQQLDAADPIYSLDGLTQHPYRYVPSVGHASQNPGSPKFFRPGYGYAIPGNGISGNTAFNLPGYSDHFEFGRSISGRYNNGRHLFGTNNYGGPWYHAGSTTNTTLNRQGRGLPW